MPNCDFPRMGKTQSTARLKKRGWRFFMKNLRLLHKSFIRSLEDEFFHYSPLSLGPFPPMGTREVVAP